MLAQRWSVIRMLGLALLIVCTNALTSAGPVRGETSAAKKPKQEREQTTIVILADGADPVAAARALGVKPIHIYRDVLTGFSAVLPASSLSSARQARGVTTLLPDGRVSAQAQRTPTGVARIGTPLPATGGNSTDVDVAIVDSGISPSKDLRRFSGIVCNGKNQQDEYSHGTHVAGTVAALNNNRDVVGVAPGARVWSVKVLNSKGAGRWSDVVCGLDWVFKYRKTIDVVNMSLAGKGNNGSCASAAIHLAVCRLVDAGIPVVVAAGNQGRNAANFIPAAYEEAITVSAFGDSNGRPRPAAQNTCERTRDDAWVGFSNYGQAVDIAAPGVCIRSLKPGGGTVVYSGTSMAAPHVTGAIARYLAANPDADVATVRNWLLTTASRPRTSIYGFSGDGDGIAEPVLYLGS